MTLVDLVSLLPSPAFLSADFFRYGSALSSVLTLFGLTVALKAYGHALDREWRLVLRAVAAQQAVIAYVTVARARATPNGFPKSDVDFALVAIFLSAVALLVTVVAVLVARHADVVRRRE